MTPLETLAKYGLDTSVKAIRKRIDNCQHRGIAIQKLIEIDDAITTIGDLETELRTADLTLLCSLAEKGERLATVQEDIGIILRATIGDLCNENHFDTAREIENKLDSINKIIAEAEGEGK